MRSMACAVVLLIVGAAAAVAQAGALRPVACDPSDGAFPPVTFFSLADQKPEPDAGSASPRAIVGIAAGAGSDLPVKVALDYSRAEAAQPDLLRLDFTYKGRFDAKSAVPMKATAAARPYEYQSDFGPATVPFARDGRTFLVSVRGMYGRMKSEDTTYHRIIFALAAAVEGKCAFGKKDLSVRFLDGTGDLRFDRPSRFASTQPRQRSRLGDIVLIDTGDGTFSNAQSVVKACYGQPVLVDGAWYDVAISPDGGSVAARPVEVKFGRVQVACDQWEAALDGDDRAILVGGSAKPVAVPAGSYKLRWFRQWSAPDAVGRRAELLAGMSEYIAGKGLPVNVDEGGTAKLDLGAPLKATVQATMGDARSARLVMRAPKTEGGDLSVSVLSPPGGWIYSKPDPPRLTVLDAAGKAIYTVSLAYG